MKFNVSEWDEISTSTFKHRGRLWLRSNLPIAVYINVDGRETLAGNGNEVDIMVESDYEVSFDPTKARVFIYEREYQSAEPIGESYTNIDRNPAESGTLQEIKRALRLHSLEQNQLRDEMRAEYNRHQVSLAKLAPTALPSVEPMKPAEPAPAPVPAETKPV